MGKASEILNNFSEQANKNISRFFYLYSALMAMKSFSENDLNSSNREKITQQIKEKLENQEDGIEIQADTVEIEKIVTRIFESGYTTDYYKISPIEKSIREVLKIIGLNFLLYPDTIFYIVQIAGRRLNALITVETLLLKALKNIFSEAEDFFETIKNNAENYVLSNEDNEEDSNTQSLTYITLKNLGVDEDLRNYDLSDYYAKRITEAKEKVKKITEAVVDNEMNPTALQEFKDTLEGIYVSKSVDLFSSYRDPVETTKKILMRTAYVSQLHKKVRQEIEQWKNILNQYQDLDVVDVFAEAMLDYIQNNLEKWREYFTKTREETLFADFRKMLIEMTSNEQTLDTLFSPESPIGEIKEEGILDWIDDKDNDDYSPYLESPGENVEIDDIIHIHSKNFDSNNVTIASHRITGKSVDYIWVEPEVQKPPEGVVYFTKIEGGCPLYGKYTAIVNYFEDINIPESLELMSSEEDTRKTWSKFLWKMIELTRDKELEKLEDHVEQLKTQGTEARQKIDELVKNLEKIQYGLESIALPKRTDIETIDDILENSDMDKLRYYFVSGRIKDFFSTSPANVSSKSVVIDKISLLLRDDMRENV